MHGGSITAELMARAESEGARVFAEFPTLNGRGYVEKHPEAWPIDAQGNNAAAATWFLGACPTEPGFRVWRMKQLNELLDRFAVAGVWMDYFHWHAQFEDPRPILPETCFSATCLASFEAASGVRVPSGAPGDRARWVLERHEREWRQWRTRHLLGWAREVKDTLRRKRPGAGQHGIGVGPSARSLDQHRRSTVAPAEPRPAPEQLAPPRPSHLACTAPSARLTTSPSRGCAHTARNRSTLCSLTRLKEQRAPRVTLSSTCCPRTSRGPRRSRPPITPVERPEALRRDPGVAIIAATRPFAPEELWKPSTSCE